tara:strand:+ start:147 stop:572 length:426 start_codon:yes stop_codon:yes gene_type:complete
MCLAYRDSLNQSLTSNDPVVLGGHGRTDEEMSQLAKAVMAENNLATGVAFIRHALNSGGTVLVHCVAGQSRSVSVLLRYLSLEYDMGLNASLSMIRAARPTANPNPSFWRQLQALDQWNIDLDMYPSDEDLQTLDLGDLML